MKNLTVFTYISVALFAVLLGVGIAVGNVWVTASSLLPLLICTVAVFHRRYFK